MARHLSFSVVIPVFNEQDVLPTLFRRLQILQSLDPDPDPAYLFDYQFIFVNDGSSDQTKLLLNRYVSGSPHKAVHLSRNFGHQAAVSAGLRFAKGDLVAIIDGDLQDPPEALPIMACTLLESGADVVYGVRQNRKERKLLRVGYFLFYRILQALSPVNIPLDSGDFSVFSARVSRAINRMPERHRFVRGLRSFAGYNQIPYHYDRDSRFAGEAKYDFRRLLGLAADGVFTFSEEPLRLSTYLGLTVSLLSLIVAVFMFSWRVIAGDVLPGFATLSVGLFFLGGVQLLCLGILGEYIGRVHNEVKRRPTYVVEDICGPY